MRNNETVCAVVVTHDRKNLLLECLNALRMQTRAVQAIYIIDNFSNDGTPQLLLNNGYIEELPPDNFNDPREKESKVKNLVEENWIKIFYVRMNENTGGAGGFYEGVKRGYEKGFEWLWLMDDDIEVKKNALLELLKYKEISRCIHPSRSVVGKKTCYWDGYFDVETMNVVGLFDSNFKAEKEYTFTNRACFEGMLIHREIIREIGYPDKRFFICYDDTMYGLKASRQTNILLTKKILIDKKIDKKGLSSFSAYYFIRNLFLVKKILDKDYPQKKKKRTVFFMVKLAITIKATFRDLNFFEAIKVTARAISDARHKRYFK